LINNVTNIYWTSIIVFSSYRDCLLLLVKLRGSAGNSCSMWQWMKRMLNQKTLDTVERINMW